MWELLNEIVSAIGTIPEVNTVKIGTETGISSKQTPAVRVVLDSRQQDMKRLNLDGGNIRVIIILDLKNDLPKLYEETIELEEAIRSKLASIVQFDNTQYDGDTVSAFKVTILNYRFGKVENHVGPCDR